MADEPNPLPARITATLLVLVAVFVAGFFLWVVVSRIGYPYELEWMEGAMADHVCRVLDGELIYVPPSYDHVAFLYHPGYFYAAALMGLVTGPGFLALRLVSLLATLGSGVVLYRLVRRDGTALGGFAAAGLFFASFSVAGCYYDVGRIDPLFTFLLLLGIELTRVAERRRGLVLAVCVFLLAWLTKQTALVILPFVVLAVLRDPVKRPVMRAAVFGFAIAITCGVAEWMLDIVHDGWLWYFNVELPRNHGILEQFYVSYWTHDVLPYLGAILLFGVFLNRGTHEQRRFFHSLWILGCVVGSYLSRLHVGGAENVLIPMIAGLSAACGLGVACLAKCCGGRYSFAGNGVATVQIVLVFLLFFMGRPIPIVPSPEMQKRNDTRLEEIKALSGPVFLPWHGYVARMAGKQPSAHAMAMDDVWRSKNEEAIRIMEESLRARLSTEPHPVVYVDILDHLQLRGMLLGLGYQPKRSLDKSDSSKPPVGSDLRPLVVMEK